MKDKTNITWKCNHTFIVQSLLQLWKRVQFWAMVWREITQFTNSLYLLNVIDYCHLRGFPHLTDPGDERGHTGKDCGLLRGITAPSIRKTSHSLYIPLTISAFIVQWASRVREWKMLEQWKIVSFVSHKALSSLLLHSDQLHILRRSTPHTQTENICDFLLSQIWDCFTSCIDS